MKLKILFLVLTLFLINTVSALSPVFITNTTATATGVITINVSNSVGSNNDTLIFLNGHANSNFSDLYFTQNDILIPFNHTDSNPEKFYLNITSLTHPIIANYGNKSINNLGNGNQTVNLYADGSTLENFTTNGVSLSGGYILINANAAGGNYITSKQKYNRSQRVVYDLTVPAYYSISGFFNNSGLQDYANPNWIGFYDAGDNNRYSVYSNVSSTAINIGARTTTKRTLEIIWRNTSTDTKMYIDGVSKTTPTTNFPSNTQFYFSVSSVLNNNVASLTIDNILLMDYSDGKFNTWSNETLVANITAPIMSTPYIDGSLIKSVYNGTVNLWETPYFVWGYYNYNGSVKKTSCVYQGSNVFACNLATGTYVFNMSFSDYSIYTNYGLQYYTKDVFVNNGTMNVFNPNKLDKTTREETLKSNFWDYAFIIFVILLIIGALSFNHTDDEYYSRR